MERQIMKNCFLVVCVAGFLAIPPMIPSAIAGPWTLYPTIPMWNPPPAPEEPLGPTWHPGKEYMWETNRNYDGTPNVGQVIAWDGAGGVANSQINYNVPTGLLTAAGVEVDAIAYHRDELFHGVVTNQTAILFSERVLVESNGQFHAVDTQYPIYYETTTGVIDPWATREQVNQHWLPLEEDGHFLNLAGLEVFGPNDPSLDNANMFSVTGDVALFPDNVRYSVYHYDLGTGDISGYLPVADIAQALADFYTVGYLDIEPLVDVDALMVWDDDFLPYEWSEEDEVLFSLAPFELGGTEYVGDAVYHLVHGGNLSYLDHGGHLWFNNWRGINIDALEAAAIPEPSSLLLLLLATLGLCRRRRSAQSHR